MKRGQMRGDSERERERGGKGGMSVRISGRGKEMKEMKERRGVCWNTPPFIGFITFCRKFLSFSEKTRAEAVCESEAERVSLLISNGPSSTWQQSIFSAESLFFSSPVWLF